MVVQGGNKVGKSLTGVHLSLGHMVGYRYWDVPGLDILDDGMLPPRERIPQEYWIYLANKLPIPVPNTGMIVTGLNRQLGIQETIWPLFEKSLPPALMKNPMFIVRKGAQSVPVSVMLPNGSRALMASAEQDELSFEGTRFQWCWQDEPVRASVFSGMWRALMIDRGRIWFTLTPLTSRCVWLYTNIVRPALRAATYDTLVVRLALRDNPYLSDEARTEFEANPTWTESERRARTEGEWEALGSRIIHTWNSNYHVIPATPLDRNWVGGQTVDPHHVRPAAVVWFKISPWGVYHFYREWPPGEYTKFSSGARSPRDYANLFRDIEGDDPPHFRLADPRFAKSEYRQHGQDVPTVWADEMARYGLHYDTRIPNIARNETGEQKIIDMLRFAWDQPIGPTNTPKILVHDCCPNLIESMENYGVLKEKSATGGFSEKPSEEFKDFIDAVRYTVLYGMPLQWVFQSGQLPACFTEDDLVNENNTV